MHYIQLFCNFAPAYMPNIVGMQINYNDYLESRSEVMLGKPVIKGTRITAEQILRMLSEGASTQDILIAYSNLQAVHIIAVLAYATDLVANETLITAA